MIDKYGTGQDPYCYPNSQVLENLLGIKDEETLENAERELTEIAVQDLGFSEPPYNYDYLKLIHKTLFTDIYAWAGEERTVDLSKQDTRFCTAIRIEPEAKRLFSDLENKKYFIDLHEDELIVQAANLYSELNAIHPFREGNGRSQRILFEQIFLHCGYPISWGSISREEWLEANIEGFFGNMNKMIAVFRKTVLSTLFL
jgi:cell filamentation protein